MSGLGLWQRGALGAALLGVVVGCAGSASDELPLADGLGDADVAVYVTQFTNDATTGGRVLLYDRGGPVSVVSHQGIRVPGLIWDDAGLFFVDQTTDFQVSDRLERHTRSRVADTLVGMQGGPNGRRVVLFNDGLSEGKNHTGVGVYSGIKEQSQQTLLDSVAGTYSSCAGGVYSAGSRSVEDDQVELIRLDPEKGGSPRSVGARRAGVLVNAGDSPCRDGSVVALWYPDGNASSLPLEAWQWSTVDGQVKRTLLRDGDQRFLVGAGTISDAQVPVWASGSGLFWVDNAGTAWRADLKTGATAKVREGLEASDGQAQSWVRRGNWMVQLVNSDGSSGAHLNVYSATDLSLVETRELPRLDELTPEGQMVLAVAVSPSFAPSSAKR